MLTAVISAVGGYLFGCFNLAYLLARMKGFDIRSRGSHNPGASNALLTLGWKAGVAVAIADILKAALAVILFRMLFDSAFAGICGGLSAVMGHMFPFWLKGKGGKGFASFAGMALGVNWRYFAIIGAVVVLIILLSDYIVLGTLAAVVTFPIAWGIMEKNLLAALLMAGVAAIILWKHIPNFKRILKGEEMRVMAALKKKK